MAQAGQFMLRMGTYGPDLLDDRGAMPEYRSRVKDVITPKFATSFDQQAGTAEQLVAQAGVARDGGGVRHRRLDHRRRLRHRPGRRARSPTRYAKGGQAAPAPFRIEVTLVKTDGEWLVDNFSPVTGPNERPDDRQLLRPPRRRPRRDRGRDQGGVEVRDRRPRPDRPPVPRLQPGRRGAARPAAAPGVRRRARGQRRGRGTMPRRRGRRDAEPGAGARRPRGRASWPRGSRGPAARRRHSPGGAHLGAGRARRGDRRRPWPPPPGCGSPCRPTPPSRSPPAPPRAPPSGRSCRSCPTTRCTSTRTSRPRRRT